jgi:hypothetical protein
LLRKKRDVKKEENLYLYSKLEENIKSTISRKTKGRQSLDEQITLALKNKVINESIDFIKSSEGIDLDKRVETINLFSSLFDKIYKNFNVYNTALTEYMNHIQDYPDLYSFLKVFGVNVPQNSREFFLRILWACVHFSEYRRAIESYEALQTTIFGVKNALKQVELPIYDFPYQNLTDMVAVESLKTRCNELKMVIESEYAFLNAVEQKNIEETRRIKSLLDKQDETYIDEIPNVVKTREELDDAKADVESVRNRIDMYYRIMNKYLNYDWLKTQTRIIAHCVAVLDCVPDRDELRRNFLSMGLLKTCGDSSRNIPEVNRFLDSVEEDFVTIVEDTFNLFKAPASR